MRPQGLRKAEKAAIVCCILGLGTALSALAVRTAHEFGYSAANTPTQSYVDPRGVALNGLPVLPKSKAEGQVVLWVVDGNSCASCQHVPEMATRFRRINGKKTVVVLGSPPRSVMDAIAPFGPTAYASSEILETIAASGSLAVLVNGEFVAYFPDVPPEAVP